MHLVKEIKGRLELAHDINASDQQIEAYDQYAQIVHKKTMRTMVSTGLAPEDHSHIYGTPDRQADYHNQHVLLLDGSSLSHQRAISPALLSIITGKFPNGLRLEGANNFIASHPILSHPDLD